MGTSTDAPEKSQRCSFRKISKPLMEKKRRARINVSLEQLKTLLEKHYSQNIRKRKLEKADILELTVKYLKNIQSTAQGAPLLKSAEYQTGFRSCLYGVSQFLLRSEDASETLYLRLLQDLGRTLPAAGPVFRTADSGQASQRILLATSPCLTTPENGLASQRTLSAASPGFRTSASRMASHRSLPIASLGISTAESVLPPTSPSFRTTDSPLALSMAHPAASRLGLEEQGAGKDKRAGAQSGDGVSTQTPPRQAPMRAQTHELNMDFPLSSVPLLLNPSSLPCAQEHIYAGNRTLHSAESVWRPW
ncbi:transcription factor HES-3 [Lissotriton helveticus]